MIYIPSVFVLKLIVVLIGTSKKFSLAKESDICTLYKNANRPLTFYRLSGESLITLRKHANEIYSSNVTTSGLLKNTPVCNRNCLRVSITSMQNANVIYHFKAEVLSFKAMYNNILFDNVYARNI